MRSSALARRAEAVSWRTRQARPLRRCKGAANMGFTQQPGDAGLGTQVANPESAASANHLCSVCCLVKARAHVSSAKLQPLHAYALKFLRRQAHAEQVSEVQVRLVTLHSASDCH